MSAAVACPLCSNRRVHAFFSLPAAPVTCTSIFPTREQALAVPTGRIALTVCEECGFVFNAGFDPTLGDVGARYESSQASSAHFSAFARSLAADWVQRHRLQGKAVLEVGCGSGEFLSRLLECGVAHATGIDPLATSPATHGLTVIADAFDERYLGLDADALVCRHTLEHVPDVQRFLKLVHDWASAGRDRVVLFELPDADRIVVERAFWDIYYEHCNYFTMATLRTAFERAGFDVLRLDCLYDGQYLIVEAQPCSQRTRQAGVGQVREAVAACDNFGVDVRSSIERCQQRLTQMAAAAPPLLLWQGAAKTVGLLATLSDISPIEGAIDLSPARHGGFLPGSALPVHGPARLPQIRPGTIVLMNPVYLTEVRDCIESFGLTTPVHPVNELLEA